MATPVYTQVAEGSRLYASSIAPPGGFAGYWCSASAAFGASATLAQTWADVGGLYVFAALLPDDLAAFAGQLGQLAPRLSPTGLVRVLWLDNEADSSWSYWPASIVTARPQGEPSGPWALVTPACLRLGDYRLVLAAKADLVLQDDADGHGMQLPASAVRFEHDGLGFAASATASLPLAGDAIGSLVVPLTLSPPEETPASQAPSGNLTRNGRPGDALASDPFDQLGVMLRYATTPDPDDSQAVAQNLARYLSMPVLRLDGARISATLYVDPDAWLDPQRSCLDLASTPSALASAFVTTLGYDVTLTPRAGLLAARSGRLAFCKSPLYAVEGENRGSEIFHLAPDGCFTVDVQVPSRVQARRTRRATATAMVEKDQWMLGNSGAEYALLDGSSGDVLVCSSGCAAYIPADSVDGTPALRDAATTAHMTVLPGTAGSAGLTYYAQPLQAALFMASSDLGDGFLDFHTMPAGSLPAQAQASDLSSRVFPMGAYRWLPSADIALARELESAVIAPTRRAVIGGHVPVDLAASGTVPLAATPQGLLAQLSADGTEWAGVLFGNLPASDQTLVFTPVQERFAQALQSNQVFFVVSDVDEFLQQSGVGASGLNCTLDGWTFRLDPEDWRTQAQENPTLMLFKYGNRTLDDLAGDTSAWGWPEAAAPLSRTQQQLQAILTTAREHAQADPPTPGDPYVVFYNDIANNPAWNGVLFFNAPVDLGLMPPDLQFLAAGIDPTQFYAHHVGFSVTPVQAADGQLTLGQTAAFGLIDYEDTEDLAPSSTVAFGFKTLQLKIRFANARIADFTAQCELMVNVLFGAPLAKQDAERGNNLIMAGTCQRVAGVPAYSFVLDGENLFDAQGSAMVGAEVLAVRIDTVTAEDGDAVTSSFTLQGNLRFRDLTGFDMFSYGANAEGDDGYLCFTGLAIRMQFGLSDPMQQAFTSFEGATTLDPAKSQLRKNSLAANFPLKASGVKVAQIDADGRGLTPEQLGFVSIACPIDQTPMSAPWWGLAFTVDLGSLGALSGSTGLSMTLLTAWSTGSNDDVPVYLGLKLASYVPGGGGSLPLQGVLKLGFRSFEFVSYAAGDGQVGYQLWMRRFALSVLAWSFPPGNADLVLFGDPGDPGGSLGWYAAYDGKPNGLSLAAPRSAKPELGAPVRRLANGRRIPPVA
jgi:hypothetical protein